MGRAEFGEEKDIQTLTQGLKGHKFFFSALNREKRCELLNDDITLMLDSAPKPISRLLRETQFFSSEMSILVSCRGFGPVGVPF